MAAQPEMVYDGSTVAAKCRTKLSDVTKWDRYVVQIMGESSKLNDTNRLYSEPFPSPDTFGWARFGTG